MGRLVIGDHSITSGSNSRYDSIASSGKRNKGSSDKKTTADAICIAFRAKTKTPYQLRSRSPKYYKKFQQITLVTSVSILL
jgi:hypothetical protein